MWLQQRAQGRNLDLIEHFIGLIFFGCEMFGIQDGEYPVVGQQFSCISLSAQVANQHWITRYIQQCWKKQQKSV
jgi:hypothetical protein